MNATRTILSTASLSLVSLLFGLSADQAQAQCYSTYATYGTYSYAPPVVYAPAPVVVARAPVIRVPAPVFVAPAPVYSAPRVIYRAPACRSVSFGYVGYRGRHHRSHRYHRGPSRSGFSFGFGFSR